MIAKILLFVLLGTALVSASPIRKVNKEFMIKCTKVDKALERSIEEVWGRLEKKFAHAIDEIKTTWEDVKVKGQDIIDTNLENIKRKGLALLEEAKVTFKEIAIEGKQAASKLDSILDSTTKLAKNLKETGVGVYEDAKKLLDEVTTTVKYNLDAITK